MNKDMFCAHNNLIIHQKELKREGFAYLSKEQNFIKR